jgi:hypothetical protein
MDFYCWKNQISLLKHLNFTTRTFDSLTLKNLSKNYAKTDDRKLYSLVRGLQKVEVEG